jgi:hypothetical protein
MIDHEVELLRAEMRAGLAEQKSALVERMTNTLEHMLVRLRGRAGPVIIRPIGTVSQKNGTR